MLIEFINRTLWGQFVWDYISANFYAYELLNPVTLCVCLFSVRSCPRYWKFSYCKSGTDPLIEPGKPYQSLVLMGVHK